MSACLLIMAVSSHADVGSTCVLSLRICSQFRSLYHCSFAIIFCSRLALPSRYRRSVCAASLISFLPIGCCVAPMSPATASGLLISTVFAAFAASSASPGVGRVCLRCHHFVLSCIIPPSKIYLIADDDPLARHFCYVLMCQAEYLV